VLRGCPAGWQQQCVAVRYQLDVPRSGPEQAPGGDIKAPAARGWSDGQSPPHVEPDGMSNSYCSEVPLTYPACPIALGGQDETAGSIT
jgi:hypothetical protein